MDEWMLESLQKYSTLHMFELPQAAKSMCWNQHGTMLYVVGFSRDQSNEISQLQLPEKLLPSEVQSLCGKRDVTIVCGAFSQTPVHSMRHISAIDALATSGREEVIQLWTQDKDSQDLMVHGRKLPLCFDSQAEPNWPVLIDHTPFSSTHLLVGKSLTTVHLMDIASGKTFLKPISGVGSRVSLHGLSFAGQGTSTFVTCAGDRGDLMLWDSLSLLNVGAAHKLSREAGKRETRQQYWIAVSTETHPGCKVARLADSGTVCLFDTRASLSHALCSVQLRTHCSLWGRGAGPTGTTPCICCNSYLLSVSGVNRGVEVHRTLTWNEDTSEAPSPLFTHTGHEVECGSCEVTTHTWHPLTSGLLLSADSEGSLHAWKCANL